MAPTSRTARYRWDMLVGTSRPFWDRLTPPQLFVGSFALLILAGTLGFKLLPGLYTGEPLSWLDAFFTSTSAVCVTGLTVIDVGSQLTFWGQAWLLLLIQLGGLGILTFASLLVLVLGGRLSLRQEALATGSLDSPAPVNARRLLLDILRFTLVLELAAAALLYALWVPRLGPDAWWHALFHAVSAFCNAGFSTFSEGLVAMRESPASLTVVMLLIIAGGLGFLTLEELAMSTRSALRRRRGVWMMGESFRPRLSLHSRLVLVSTVLLILSGWVLFIALEWQRTLAELPLADRLLNALFLSVTPRTAGFHTIDYSTAAESTNLVTILLMTVGGSPGSTAGGLKTTTAALICLYAWSRIRGETVTSAYGRSVRQELLGRAIGLCVVSFVVIIVGLLLLTVFEEGRSIPGGFLGRLFEAVSAFNTVGLSLNVTPHLSVPSRGVVILLMFLGRVGTVTFVAAVALRPSEGGKFRYAYEEVMIG